jgi:hypothetical protein
MELPFTLDVMAGLSRLPHLGRDAIPGEAAGGDGD